MKNLLWYLEGIMETELEGSRPCERPSQQRSALDLGHTRSGSIAESLRRTLAGNYSLIDLVYSTVPL